MIGKTFIGVATLVALICLGLTKHPSATAAPVLATGAPCPLDPTLTCVMTGLDSPRGLAFGPEGALYVAEAGRGAGAVVNPAADPNCFVTSTTALVCYGPTGAVTRLWRNTQTRIATGLPSFAFPGKGNRGIGPADIAFLGRGGAYISIGLESAPSTRDTMPELASFGTLVHMAASGEWRVVSDIAQFENDHNPDGGARDSDPFGLLVEPAGAVVADAGANDLIRIDANREISVLATFPSRASTPPRPSGVTTPATSDAVPTTVVAGPDGAYYIGELTGFPFTNNRANIYRLDPATDPIPHTFAVSDAFLTGFKTIIDMAFDRDDTLYVLQYSTGAVGMGGPGILVRLVPDKTQPDIKAQYKLGTRTTVLGNLPQPTSVAVGPDGQVYVSIRGAMIADGAVIRFTPPMP
ncbi:MAG: hypothetical protein V7647_170 [Acidobacteriota bacterium]|jgi:hypothetical protein